MNMHRYIVHAQSRNPNTTDSDSFCLTVTYFTIIIKLYLLNFGNLVINSSQV